MRMKGNGYKNIAKELREKIIAGEFPPGERLTSEHRLCEIYGVERTTVRRALSLLSEEGLIMKRPGYGSIVKPSGSPNAPLISFIVFSLSDEVSGGLKHISHNFIGPVYTEFSKILEKEGFRSVAMTINGKSDIKSFTEALSSSYAVVLADNVPERILDITRKSGVPCVLMSERALGFRSVVCDNDGGLLQAVKHLCALGHKKIAYMGGDKLFLNSRAREDGFRRAMFSEGLYEEKPITELCGWNIDAGFNAGLSLLEKNPDITAICTVNDSVALGVLRAAGALGKKVPEELSVIGFGDTVFPEATGVDLTTVRISPLRFATELMFALKREIDHPYENPGTLLVESELVLRETTASN